MKRIVLFAIITTAIILCGCTNVGNEDSKPAAAFTYEEATYELYVGEGKDTRLGVYVVRNDKSGASVLEEYSQDVAEPLDEKIKVREIYIEGTDMKFVYGKAFGKRYKPYYDGEPYGRLDRNNMFFYAVKENENVDIEYR